MKIPKQLSLGIIKIYQKFISPSFSPRCRFYPSCSSYAAQAIRKHGAWKGSRFTLGRIVKCHPWHPGGIDNVP